MKKFLIVSVLLVVLSTCILETTKGWLGLFDNDNSNIQTLMSKTIFRKGLTWNFNLVDMNKNKIRNLVYNFSIKDQYQIKVLKVDDTKLEGQFRKAFGINTITIIDINSISTFSHEYLHYLNSINNKVYAKNMKKVYNNGLKYIESLGLHEQLGTIVDKSGIEININDSTKFSGNQRIKLLFYKNIIDVRFINIEGNPEYLGNNEIENYDELSAYFLERIIQLKNSGVIDYGLVMDIYGDALDYTQIK